MLGFLSAFSVGEKHSVFFNYSQFISDVIREKILKFKSEGMFKYQLFLVYLMLFYEAHKFNFQLPKMDD